MPEAVFGSPVYLDDTTSRSFAATLLELRAIASNREERSCHSREGGNPERAERFDVAEHAGFVLVCSVHPFRCDCPDRHPGTSHLFSAQAGVSVASGVRTMRYWKRC